MHTIQAAEIPAQLKEVFSMALNGQAVKLQSPSGALVAISEDEYGALVEARKYAQYRAKLEASFEQAQNAQLAHKTMEDLDAVYPNQETRDAIAELEAGGGKEFATIADLMADLNADD